MNTIPAMNRFVPVDDSAACVTLFELAQEVRYIALRAVKTNVSHAADPIVMEMYRVS